MLFKIYLLLAINFEKNKNINFICFNFIMLDKENFFSLIINQKTVKILFL